MGPLKLVDKAHCDSDCSRAIAELKRAQRDVAFFNERRASLLQKYPDQWIAIFGRRVVGHNADLVKLTDSLRRRGIDPGTALVQFLSLKKRLYVL